MSADENGESHPDDDGIKILSSAEDSKNSDSEGTPESLVVVVEEDESGKAAADPVVRDSHASVESPELKKNASLRRLSRKFSDGLRRSSSVLEENAPKTPSGWAMLSSVLASCLLGYEVRLQRSLTCPPTVYAQHSEGQIKAVYDKLTESDDSILRRQIQPSLFVGTRSAISTTAAYLLRGPSATADHIQFREIMNMTLDGGRVALEWELPVIKPTAAQGERELNILKGPIESPVVLIIHGVNNDASFGYIRSMMRACSDNGWIAAGMNLRGCGGVRLSTPRAYNGAYTGDIRCVVQRIESRLKKGVPLFLVGNSLGASLVTKYLGEEGLSGTLPRCIAGGAALGTPSSIKVSTASKLMSPLLALGTKKLVLQNWRELRHMNDDYSRACVKRALASVSLEQFDNALAPVLLRNEPIYPFAFRLGYKDASAYYNDASSYRLVRFISVPVLQLIASDDFLVYSSFQGKLAYSLANPNVMVVESKCGGHLGWQESPPDTKRHHGKASWADAATTDFIAAVFESYEPDKRKRIDIDNYLSRERDRILSSRSMQSRL